MTCLNTIQSVSKHEVGSRADCIFALLKKLQCILMEVWKGKEVKQTLGPSGHANTLPLPFLISQPASQQVLYAIYSTRQSCHISKYASDIM